MIFVYIAALALLLKRGIVLTMQGEPFHGFAHKILNSMKFMKQLLLSLKQQLKKHLLNGYLKTALLLQYLVHLLVDVLLTKYQRLPTSIA